MDDAEKASKESDWKETLTCGELNSFEKKGTKTPFVGLQLTYCWIKLNIEQTNMKIANAEAI